MVCYGLFIPNIGFMLTIRIVVGFCFLLKTLRMDAINPIQLQAILPLPHSVGSRSVMIGTLLTSYPLARAGTVLYVTIVNIILAKRINALYKGNRYCWIFLGFLVVGEFHLRRALRLSQPTY